MNSNKKAGRPKGPEKILFRVRVEPWKVKELRWYLGRLDKSREGEVSVMDSDEDLLDRREPEIVVSSKEPVDQKAVLVHVGKDEMLSDYKKNNRMLLDDIQGLTVEVNSLKIELEEARSSNLDVNGFFWKEKYLLAKRESEAHGEFSQ